MTEQIKLMRIKLGHLTRMHGYLRYSLSQVERTLLAKDWAHLSPDQHESLAAFRVRFSEFHEHLGKTMRSVAIEEEQDVERFGPVLAYMELFRLPALRRLQTEFPEGLPKLTNLRSTISIRASSSAMD